MKKNRISPFVVIVVAFILLNMLGGVIYRFNWWFENNIIWYVWVLLFFGGSMILIWGIKSYLNQYRYNAKSNRLNKANRSIKNAN
jgi:protein-S-isoprenylcysteine O-methyltransferase Ste14